jgi:hypothetical protein
VETVTPKERVILTAIKELQFPTINRGLVCCAIKVEVSPELKIFGCGGVIADISTKAQDGVMPFRKSDMIAIKFDSKGEILDYKIRAKKGFTKLPETCSFCGKKLTQLKEKGKLISLICTNFDLCLAQSSSHVIRLLKLANPDASNADCMDFIDNHPEGQIGHVSDMIHLMKSDPNTASRQDMWSSDECWKMEVELWKLLNSKTLKNTDFWYLFMGSSLDVNPRTIGTENYKLTGIRYLSENFDRFMQLHKVLDQWTVREYVK